MAPRSCASPSYVKPLAIAGVLILILIVFLMVWVVPWGGLRSVAGLTGTVGGTSVIPEEHQWPPVGGVVYNGCSDDTNTNSSGDGGSSSSSSDSPPSSVEEGTACVGPQCLVDWDDEELEAEEERRIAFVQTTLSSVGGVVIEDGSSGGGQLGTTSSVGMFTLHRRCAPASQMSSRLGGQYQEMRARPTGTGEGDLPFHCRKLKMSIECGAALESGQSGIAGDDLFLIEEKTDGTGPYTRVVMPSYSLGNIGGYISRLETLWAFVNGIAGDYPAVDGAGNFIVTYSVMQAGTSVPGGLVTQTLQEYYSGSSVPRITAEQFRGELERGMTMLTNTFAHWIPERRVYFRPIAQPATGTVSLEQAEMTSIPVAAEYLLGEKVGDIRIGMISGDPGDGWLGVTWLPLTDDEARSGRETTGYKGGIGADMLFNSRFNFRLDTDDASDGSYSILWVFLHELFHALGISHDAALYNLMTPTVSAHYSVEDMYPQGIIDTPSDVAALLRLYKTETPNVQDIAQCPA